MDVHVLRGMDVRDAAVAELPVLLAARDGGVWVDVPVWDEQAEGVLARELGFHPLALRDCAARKRLPKVHAYPDTLFIVLHARARRSGARPPRRATCRA